MYVTLDLSEVHDLAGDLRRAADTIRPKASVVVRRGGFATVAFTQQFAPVDTGELRASESVDFTADGLGFEAGPTAEHGIYQELGTSEMSAQPSLGPGFDRALPGIVNGLADAGSRIL